MIWDLDRIEQKQSCWKHKWNSVILKRVEIKQRFHSTYLNYHKMSATVCESAVRMFEKSQFPELS